MVISIAGVYLNIFSFSVVGKVGLEPSSLGRKINGNEAQQEKILEKSAPKMEKIASSKNFETPPRRCFCHSLPSLWSQPGSNFTKFSPNSSAGKRGFGGRKLSKAKAGRKFTSTQQL
jgi:hypothetical protein